MAITVRVKPGRGEVESATRPTAWETADGVLYDLCRAQPSHSDSGVLIAKVWLIGRAYAAPIERGRSSGGSAEAYYEDVVAPAVVNSGLDAALEQIPIDQRCRTPSDAVLVLRTHQLLTEVFASASGRDNRSLASKYLHFHRPLAFPIYDSRAETELRRRTKGQTPRPFPDGDSAYRWFVARYQALAAWVAGEYGIELTPRCVDRLLLARSVGVSGSAL